MLCEFITLNRDEIIRRCRAKVSARTLPTPTAAEIDHGVPVFLDQLVSALRGGQSSSLEISQTALLHGQDLHLQGLTLTQVVHDYGDVCQSITELAAETAAPISAAEFGLLNGCLDSAIAVAITEYGRERNKATIDVETVRENERLGFFTHELKNLLHTALLSFEVIRSGNVSVAGTTGGVLHRSLTGARDLVARALAETRLTQGVQNRQPLLVATLVDELTQTASLAAISRGHTFAVEPIADDIAICADGQVLSAVLMNMLQNALKFTRPRSAIVLRVVATSERVQIEVQDQCGGLNPADVEGMFHPFEKRHPNRTGLGMGLAFSRWATEANGGQISARNLPGIGCIFTIDLPRCPAPAVVAA